MNWTPIDQIPEETKRRNKDVLLYDGHRTVTGPYFSGYFTGDHWVASLDGLTPLHPSHYAELSPPEGEA